MLDFNKFHLYTKYHFIKTPSELIQEGVENARDFVGSSWLRIEDKAKSYLVAHMVEMSLVDKSSEADTHSLTVWGKKYLLSII